MRGLSGFLKEQDIPYRTEVQAATLTTFRVGGVCELAVTPLCLRQLAVLTTYCAYHRIQYAVVGRGSNLLLDDGRIGTVLILTEALDAVEIGQEYLTAQCGCSLPSLVRRIARHGYADLVFAAGIPGSVGGAAYMNAGAMGEELSSSVAWVESYLPLERKIRTYTKEELDFSYRNSVFQANNEVILRVGFRLVRQMKPEEIFSLIRQNMAKRALTQPLEWPNAGSVFRRPRPDIAVGRLLDDLGLKGLRCGGAAVSEKHAGFIVNLGGATAADVKCLMNAVRDTVKERTGICLVPEIREI